MNIDIEIVDNTTVVIPRGDVDMLQSSKLREVLKPVLDNSTARVVVDLSEVGYMDSSGIATLIEALQICKQKDMQFVICNLGEGVRSIIELARLDTIFMITSSREEALGA